VTEQILFYDLRTDEGTIELALKMSMKGMSTGAIADVLGVQLVTVSNWLSRAAGQCDRVNEAKMKNLDLPKIEMDEMWVIIQKKVPRMKNYEDDGPWMWVAFAPGCRLIIAFVIGPRKQYVADKLVELTAKCVSGFKPLFVTDGLKFYAEAILKEYGETEEFPRTGKRGRPIQYRMNADIYKPCKSSLRAYLLESY
jgi:IS1 family transposase